MNAKKPKEEKQKKEPREEAAKVKPPAIGAMERCQAVLSVWTEKRRPAEVCRDLSIAQGVFTQWQERALEGMLQALEPRMNLERGAALPPRLLHILEKQKARLLRPKALKGRLEKRLAGLKMESPSLPTLTGPDKVQSTKESS
jgi:hypothetical protein